MTRSINLIVYLEDNLDAFTAAYAYHVVSNGDDFAAHKVPVMEYIFIPMGFDKNIYEELKSKIDPHVNDGKYVEVNILDLNFPEKQLLDLSQLASYTVIYDHHPSGEKVLTKYRDNFEAPNLECCYGYDKTGAGIVWNSRFGVVRHPWFLKYVQDHELNKFDLEDTHAVIAALSEKPRDFDVYDQIRHYTPKQIEKFIEHGKAIVEGRDELYSYFHVYAANFFLSRMLEKGITMKKLSEMTGIPNNRLDRILVGRSELMNLRDIAYISTALNVKPDIRFEYIKREILLDAEEKHKHLQSEHRE